MLIPAFIISELKTGFQMGFFLFVPFLLIDLIVSTTLLSMGMLQLPPSARDTARSAVTAVKAFLDRSR